VLSATVLPIDGTYEIKKIPIFWGEAETSKVSPSLLVGGESRVLDLTGIKHYIGHPSTALIVEGWGAIKAESNLFAGLDVGQYAFAVSIKQGLSTRKNAGKTYDQVVTEKDLIVRRIKRIA